jgi:cytoskeletal protein CcmA (bactofilin family)
VHVDSEENRSDVSVVGRGTRIEGTVTAAGALRVEGEVVGAITAEGDVSLTLGAQVEANIQAQSIALAGRVKGDLAAEGDVSLPPDSRLDGNIRARNVAVGGVVNGEILAMERVELGPRAQVRGDLATKALVIAEGAVFNGRSNVGGDPRPDKRIATAASADRPGRSRRSDEPAAMTPHPS